MATLPQVPESRMIYKSTGDTLIWLRRRPLDYSGPLGFIMVPKDRAELLTSTRAGEVVKGGPHLGYDGYVAQYPKMGKLLPIRDLKQFCFLNRKTAVATNTKASKHVIARRKAKNEAESQET